VGRTKELAVVRVINSANEVAEGQEQVTTESLVEMLEVNRGSKDQQRPTERYKERKVALKRRRVCQRHDMT